MPRKNPDVEETDEKDLEVGKPKEWAAGIPGVLHSMQPAIKHMGVGRTRKTLLAMNQKDGFDCMSCAWPDPDHRKTFEFCENGAKAVTWEATPVVIAVGRSGRSTRSANCASRTEYWLGMQGRLTEPVYKPAGEDHYRPVSWDEALRHRGPTSSTAWPARTRPPSTRAAGRRTRPPSSTSCSCGPSAPTTCRTAPTCATNPPAGPWARPSASARPRSPTTTSPRRS